MTTAPVVIVTRPRARAEAMMRALAEGGAEPLLLPAIEIRPPEDPTELRQAARTLGSFDWIVFTSANAVRAVAEARRGRSVPEGPRLAAVGSATAKTVTRLLGRPPEVVPTEHSAADLLEALRAHDEGLAKRSVLLPLGDLAGGSLARGLRDAGARVARVTAYRTTPPDRVDLERVRAALREDRARLVTFTSPSTVENFLEAVGAEARAVPAAVIGPVTAEAARERGFRVEAVAEPSSVEALVQAALDRILEP